MDKLPYPIPGPAGTLPRPRPQSSSTMPAQPDRFSVLSWNQMQQSLSLPPYGSHKLAASLALLRRNALLNFRHNLSNLPVIVDSLHWVGHDASVTLIDPTATMSATIYATVFENHPNTPIRAGTVLVLKDVIAFAYSSRSAGFRVDPSSAVHLNIRPPHIETVIPVPDSPITQQPLSVGSLSPSALYTSFAFAPVMPPVRPRRPSSFNPQPQQNSFSPQPPSKPLLPHNRHPQPANAAHRAPFVPPSKKRQFPNQNDASKSQPFPNKRTALPLNRPSFATPASTPPYSVPPSNITAYLPPQTISNPTAVTAISDEQLDSILGDFDLDAAIAAHEKSTPSKETTTPATLQSKPAGEGSGLHGQNPLGEHDPTPHQSKSKDSNANQASMPALPNPPSLGPASTVSNPADQPENATTTQTALSSVDDAMIQSLFDGLDASDFG